MTRDELYDFWRFEEEFPFSGWDFGHLDGRWEGEPLPWDFYTEVQRRLRRTDQLLEVDTGGDFLLSLRHPYENTAVTETWGPDAEDYRNMLAPLGIRVEECDAAEEPLPFAENAFDIAISRRGEYRHDELFRVLRPGGLFLTEQVGGRNNALLARRLLPDYRPPYPHHHLSADCEAFAEAGFELLDAKEYFPKLRFYDTGALVYYTHMIDWEFPGFSVDRCLPELFALERELSERGYVESMEHRYLIVARKPAK